MRLTVRDEREDFNQQTCGYAEYRAFSTLVSRGDRVSDVTITLTRGRSKDQALVVCTIAIETASGETAEARAAARHAYAAIDAAVSRIAKVQSGCDVTS